jgi:hypothetical protein
MKDPGSRRTRVAAKPEIGERGVRHPEHALCLARARRVRTMGGVAIFVEAPQARQRDRWRCAHLLIVCHLPRDADQRRALARGIRPRLTDLFAV